MDLDEVRAFLAVYEARSFSAASAALTWPRATVRRRVEALEARLSASLFTRTAYGAQPTEAATRLVPHAREVLHRARAMLRSVRHTDGDLRGVLHVGMPPGVPPALTGAMLGALRVSAPELAFVASIVVPPFGPELLERDIDLLLYQGDAGPGPGWHIEAHAQVRRWLIASPALLDAYGRPTEPACLERFALLVQGSWADPPGHLPTLDGLRVPVRPAMVHPDVHLLHQLAAAGAGIAFVPDGEFDQRALGIAPVEVVLGDVIGDVVTIHVAVPDGLLEVPRVRATLDHLSSLLRVL